MNKICYKVYHANLAFSAIPEEKLEEVIDKCYFSLLEFVEKTETKIGLEISGYSLEIIEEVRPHWIIKFKEIYKKGLIELIGCGYMQVIGPLVPYKVNLQNQKIGLETYMNVLEIVPKLAFVNEQTFSKSLVDLYYKVGYEALIMEWNNAYSLNEKIKKDFAYSPIIVKGINKELPLLWSDSILFQKFQRTVHGERDMNFYINFLKQYTKEYEATPVYSSDLEIFNFRPGRFETEQLIKNNEWKIIAEIVENLKQFCEFQLPSKVLEMSLNKNKKISLTTSLNPIIVKKQDKYSLSRWAACGRGANYINTLCYRYFQRIKNIGDISQWKTLLKYWGSDYRTHITEDKWEKAINDLENLAISGSNNTQILKKSNHNFYEKNNSIIYEKNNLKILFDKKKGLTLDSIFIDNKKFPICTIKHGELDLIKHGADFFTGTTIIESSETKKISDLIEVEDVNYYELDKDIYIIESSLKMKSGINELKSWIIDEKDNSIIFDLVLNCPIFIRGSIRVGILTLDKTFALKNGSIKVKNGNKYYEKINLKNNEINQHIPKSLTQSSISGIGCTNGVMKFENDDFSFKIKVNQEISYPFIMLQNNKDKFGYLTRVYFSLQELDDTLEKRNDNFLFRLRYKIKFS
ncbi:hypothetical protein [Halarcobacter anaerophilus]|uniref:Glycoside hydrolase family 57 N-terminal domain-containing protein n=1 Tax=Halarcobacter anaerophilus TaxID=877500 RepID=A0A4Q0XZI2_9BACT|nr:hypothetical protein [Halarcobacter anaerophilus]QDF30225.1 GH57N_PfGalA_like domain-containing protein [Halarcobacter anaerophilus]RXJ62214.1 hypothetical protein CRV06_10645 [Halarcobacter anaerophilus]